MSQFTFSKQSGIFSLDGKEFLHILPYKLCETTAEDVITEISEGVFRWDRNFYLSNKDICYDTFSMEAETLFHADFYCIPGVNYNGNPWGNGKEPRGLSKNGEPYVYASHRSTIPGCTFSESGEISVGMFGIPNSLLSFSCSLREKEGRLIHGLYFPERETPDVYCARDRYEGKPYYEPITLNCHGVWTSTAYLVFSQASKKGHGYSLLLDTAWKLFSNEKSLSPNNKLIWDLGIDFIKNCALYHEDEFYGFCMGLTYDGTKWIQKTHWLEVGWVGQNASLAVSLLYDFRLRNCEDSLSQGLKVLDAWAHYAPLPNGLFRCRFDRILKHETQWDNSEELEDSANLSAVVEQYLQAYHILSDLGIERENYRKIALNICDFAVQHQQENGLIGKAWYNNGELAQADGSSGSYMVWVLCQGFAETNENRYFDSAEKGFTYYYDQFSKNGYSTAGALDTCCIDKESAMPLLDCAIFLYEKTGAKHYLQSATEIGEYLATWQYHYDVKFPSNSILASLNYSTRGGTAVSTQHHHIDCYGLYFFHAYLKLSEYTQNEIWYQRAIALWNNACNLISDGNLIIKGQRRPRGSQDEGFLQTRWHTTKGEYFGVSEWLVVWNTAFRLQILRNPKLNKILEEFSKNPQNSMS